ncbi:unnamed protein product [Pedinophyceae sp. YPF-701]|nr:unnamed protein product [Pedinophyceae sp. YPF-701]
MRSGTRLSSCTCRAQRRLMTRQASLTRDSYASCTWIPGPLLHAVAASGLFPDSKTFPDLSLRPGRDAPGVIRAFEDLITRSGDSGVTSTLARHEIADFVNTHFCAPGSEIVEAVPEDWSPSLPAEFTELLHSKCASQDLSSFATSVHALWRQLTRRVTEDASDHADAPASTLIALDRPVVVPGDRFSECYYWDSLWVVEGLIASGLTKAAEGLVSNLLSLVARYGKVPNGGRDYYLNRSQPPVLALAVERCVAALPDRDAQALRRSALPLLVREHEFWTSGPHRVEISAEDQIVNAPGVPRELSRYWAEWDVPRPESYEEDLRAACQAAGVDPGPPPRGAAPGRGFDISWSEARWVLGRQRRLMRDVATAAESGWDFSGRWAPGGWSGIPSLRTTAVVPVDLNVLLVKGACSIARLAAAEGDDATAGAFGERARRRMEAMEATMWDAGAGRWGDLMAVESGGSRGDGGGAATRSARGPYASDFWPLWCSADADVLGAGDAGRLAAAVAALAASGLVQPGGVSASREITGEQWDAPNAWPPLQAVAVDGLLAAADALGHAGDAAAARSARALATDVASRFLGGVWDAWRTGGAGTPLHEKYRADERGRGGGGGEYPSQMGFGWTNGVVLKLLRAAELWTFDPATGFSAPPGPATPE